MRLVDADALLAEYDRQHEGEPGKARKLIEDAPTIDRPTRSQFKRMAAQLGYEPVIHCRECKHYRNHPNGLCYAHTEPDDNERGYKGETVCVDPEDFCSYGERKNDFVDDNKIGERKNDV
nr:MAG TPA: hypothetical protein [Caudoviricetes sp.]